MYTKNQMEDGTVFYFNASLNKSVWKPPADSIIHEAANLKIIQDAATSSSSSYSSSSSSSSEPQQPSMTTTESIVDTEVLPAGIYMHQDLFFE